MGQSGFDLCINIFLDLCPVLWLVRRVLWDQRAKISRLDGGQDSELRYAVEVFDDCTKARLDLTLSSPKVAQS